MNYFIFYQGPAELFFTITNEDSNKRKVMKRKLFTTIHNFDPRVFEHRNDDKETKKMFGRN